MWKGKGAVLMVYVHNVFMLADLLDGFQFQGQVVFCTRKEACVRFPICKGERAESTQPILPVGTARQHRAPSRLANRANCLGCLAPFLDTVSFFQTNKRFRVKCREDSVSF